ncbi:Hsp70 family protein [Dactylosporangium sp. CA-092794]|uniref:Hsp70 family protein n=1 Tax=Dactylosporangium sp. CA-092794 TaxID=3239929 RepID=UPI003D90A5C4
MYGIGIDLGTSFVAAAIVQDGSLDMVRLSGQAFAVPSVAYLDERDGLVTGEAADRLSLQSPARAAREFKRRLGDPTPMILAGAPHSPTALMAALLSDVLKTVGQGHQEPPGRVVLTHPAVWGPYRREQFAGVPPLAGLPAPGPAADAPAAAAPAVRLVTEPVAAATYYCSTRPLPPDGLLAVYDLGGGTFDSAVVRNGRDGLEVVGTPEGIEWLGGADFDQAVLSHVDQRLDGALSSLDLADPATAPILAAVLRDCTLAKEALSTREAAEVDVPLPGSPRQVSIARDTFERMIGPSLDATVEAFRRTLSAAGITPQDLTAVLLTGGSSPIPLVSRKLREALGRPILSNTHPKHAVALGAAMLAANGAYRPAAQARTTRPAPAAQTTTSQTTTAQIPVAQAVAADRPAPPPAPPRRADPGPADGQPRPKRARRRRGRRMVAFAVLAALAVAALLLASIRPTQRGADLAAGATRTAAAQDSASPVPPAGPSDPPSLAPSASLSPAAPSAGARLTATQRPAPPPAGVAEGGVGQIRGTAAGLCVDSDTNPARSLNGVPLGGHAFAAACSASANQRWREGSLLSHDVPGTGHDYRLLNQQTGFCLDSDGNGETYTLPCLDPNDHQIWHRASATAAGQDAAVAYQNRATGRCLSVDPADGVLRTTTCPVDGDWPAPLLFQRLP